MSEEKKEESLSRLDRMKAEFSVVASWFKSLDDFIVSEKFSDLELEERRDLAQQWRHMDGYLTVLKRRIEKMIDV